MISILSFLTRVYIDYSGEKKTNGRGKIQKVNKGKRKLEADHDVKYNGRKSSL